MDLSVIENDPKEVKKYLQNFVPINYYRVLDDAYLYQIRAVLLHSVSHAELYNPVYAGLINDLTVTSGKNYATINTKLEVYADEFSALATKTETIRIEAANANASIIEIQEASASQNRAQASVNQRLEASLDDIVVGGRNIMKNSDFSKGYRAWQEASITKHNHFIGTMHKISSTGIVGSLMGIYPLSEYQNMAMVEGTQYSISFYAYGSILLMDEIYLTSASEAPIKLPSIVISTDLSERRHITFKAPTGGGGLGLIFGATATSKDDWFSISRIKVELGNRPTDWTPAPEDVDGYIAQVQSSIDTFKEVQVERNLATATSLESLDSRVKDNVASILTERNTRVDQHSAQAIINNELYSETLSNKASIKSTEETFTTRYEAHSLKLETLEAESSEGQGKIENLESVTANLSGVVTTQGSTLTARLNNLNVGGRNLLRNSDFKLGVDNWGTATNKSAKSIFGNLVTVTNTGNNTNYYGLTPVALFKTINIIKGKEYVLSFYAKGNVPLLNEIWITLGTHLPQKLGIAEIDENLAHRSEFVFIANESTDVASIIIGTSGYAKGKWFSVAATKLELGNKATDWTKAPEDTEGRLIEINASIESFKEAQALENEATATRFDNMNTQYGESFGSINEKYELVSNELGTTAQAILDLNSTTDNNSASITELKETTSTNSGSIATMNSKLVAEYIPKVENIEANIKNAVKSTDVEYYLSTSTTAPVGGSWLTTAPPWTPSKYMFQRIKTTYVNGLIKHTPSINGTNISGAKGDKGLDGVNGVNGLEGPKGDKGIPGVNGVDGKSRFTHLAYATSSAGANFSPSHFSTATYIGMYVDDKEEDSEVRTKYNWSLIKGADGTHGTPGAKGADGKTPYFHVAYATSADGSQGFSTKVSAGKTYIGQYTDYKLEDEEKDKSLYSWTKIKGDDGKDGAVGQGVDKIVEQYAVSTSKTVVPTSWGTVMPVWSYGLYVWTRSQITYKNPVEVAYTQPLVDSSWEAVNNLEVGGRNLFSLATCVDGYLTAGEVVASSATHQTDERYIKIRNDLPIIFQSWNLNKVNITNSNRAAFYTANKVYISQIQTPKLLGTEYEKVIAEVPSNAAYIRIGFIVSDEVYVKAEQGNVATDWSPAPEEDRKAIEGSIAITNKLTNDFGDLKAEASVLTTVGNKISGWKNLNNGTTSSFDILADKFSVGTATTMVKPFSISGSDIVFNGKVSFNSMTGTVSSSQIPTGTINLDHMVLADKNKINTASTTAASALTNAGAAQTKANQAATAASTADGKAVSAQSTADGIKTNIYYPNTTTIDGGVIRTNTITALQIAANTITANQMTTDSITARELKASTVSATHIVGNTITGDKLVVDAITSREIKADAVTATQIKVTNLASINSNLGDITGGSIKIGSNFNVTTAGVLTATSGTFKGDITGASGNFSGTVYANKISGKVANIADAAIKTAQIDNLAVTTGKIANLSVDTLQINDYAVTVPRVFYSPSFPGSGTEGAVFTYTSEAKDISLNIGFEYWSGESNNFLRVYVDGSRIRNWSIPPNSYYFSQPLVISNALGKEIKLTRTSLYPIIGATMTIIGAKK